MAKSAAELSNMFSMLCRAIRSCGCELCESKLALWNNYVSGPVKIGSKELEPETMLVFLGVLSGQTRPHATQNCGGLVEVLDN